MIEAENLTAIFRQRDFAQFTNKHFQTISKRPPRELDDTGAAFFLRGNSQTGPRRSQHIARRSIWNAGKPFQALTQGRPVTVAASRHGPKCREFLNAERGSCAAFLGNSYFCPFLPPFFMGGKNAKMPYKTKAPAGQNRPRRGFSYPKGSRRKTGSKGEAPKGSHQKSTAPKENHEKGDHKKTPARKKNLMEFFSRADAFTGEILSMEDETGIYHTVLFTRQGHYTTKGRTPKKQYTKRGALRGDHQKAADRKGRRRAIHQKGIH